jgi:hypothetical protein
MDSTFLCRLKLPDDEPGTLAGIAEQIKESLEMDGLEVLSVQPWSRQAAEPVDLNPSAGFDPFTL